MNDDNAYIIQTICTLIKLSFEKYKVASKEELQEIILNEIK